MARLFTVDYGDGTPPETSKAGGVPHLHVFPRKATYTVRVTDPITGKSSTRQLTFPPDFVIEWAVTAEALGIYRLVATITTPPAVDSITARIRTLNLSTITKNAPGKFTMTNVGAASLFNASEALTIVAAGYEVHCTVTPTKVSSGRCESYAPLISVKHASNAGVLGIGRGTWLTPYAESGVAELNLRWLNSNGTPYDGQVIKVPTWRETGFAYWYGYKAELTIPGSPNAKLICAIGPDGTCTL